MLTIYQSDAKACIQKVATTAHNSLLYMVNPTDVEITNTAKKLSIPQKFFHDSLDAFERPRIEKAEDALLIVLNLPVVGNEEIPYQTMPIGVIHAENHLVIVSKEELPFFPALLAGKYGSFQTHMKTRITLLIFEAIMQSYGDFQTDVTKQVRKLQQKLKSAYRNNELFGMINLNKSLVSFSTAVSAMKIVFERLAKGLDIKLYTEDERMLQDVLIDIRQAVDVIEMRRESLSNLMDAYAVIISNNLNTVFKILTSLTIILVIPTMLGSIFSMNVALPYEFEVVSTIVVGSLMVIISSLLVYMFFKKKYFKL